LDQRDSREEASNKGLKLAKKAGISFCIVIIEMLLLIMSMMMVLPIIGINCKLG
jgi:hypothetical protein